MEASSKWESCHHETSVEWKVWMGKNLSAHWAFKSVEPYAVEMGIIIVIICDLEIKWKICHLGNISQVENLSLAKVLWLGSTGSLCGENLHTLLFCPLRAVAYVSCQQSLI